MSTSAYTIDLTTYPECTPLVAEATRLIQSGKKPIIRNSGVPSKVQLQARFRGVRETLRQLYKDPSYAVGNCVHEAAHALIMEEDALPNVRFSGPGILYNKQTDQIFPYGARVDNDADPTIPADENVVLRRTMHIVVGGIAMETYTGITEKSDHADYTNSFLPNYLRLPAQLRKEEPERFWERAQSAVKSGWLVLPGQKEKVLARALDYLSVLYR
jgi:hypothetical protein